MQKLNISAPQLSKASGIKLQTLYKSYQESSKYRLDFFIALVIADSLEISITELIQPIPGLKIPEPITKWTVTAKKQYLKDYNTFGMDQVTELYNITPRTAGEYKRIFTEELKITG